MLLKPQKDCSFSPEGQTPAPTPVLSLPCQPSPILCKREVEAITEDFHKRSGQAHGLHLSI